MDIHHRSRSPTPGVKREVFRRLKEQKKECDIRGEWLVRLSEPLTRTRAILTPWPLDVAITLPCTSTGLSADIGSGYGLIRRHRE